jgi:hypothetical protein
MLRFTIRDVLWLTVVVALSIGWWLDHRSQATAVTYYRDANESWLEKVQLLDEMLTKGFGFEIKRDGNSKSYIPPADLPLNRKWPASK